MPPSAMGPSTTLLQCSGLFPLPSTTVHGSGRCFATSTASLKAKAPRPLDSTHRSSTRKFVEELRRRDDHGNLSARHGQASRAFSPQLAKPFANLDRWPPPANYLSKGHKKPAMAKTSLRQKPTLRELTREEDLEKGWTHVFPPGEGQTLAQTLKDRKFKKVRHFAGGVSGGAPSWIVKKEKARLREQEGRDAGAGSSSSSSKPDGKGAGLKRSTAGTTTWPSATASEGRAGGGWVSNNSRDGTVDKPASAGTGKGAARADGRVEPRSQR